LMREGKTGAGKMRGFGLIFWSAVRKDKVTQSCHEMGQWVRL
jgi:hypothetical protein